MQKAFRTLALRVCVHKTIYFTNKPDAHIVLDGEKVMGVNRLEILGADVQIPDHEQPHPRGAPPLPQQGRNAKRWQLVLPRIQLLRHLPGGPQYKAKIATTCIAALWRYAPMGILPTKAQLQGAQQALQTAIFGTNLREAAREVLQGHLLPFHFTHLDYAQPYALLRLLRRQWLQGKLTETTPHTTQLVGSYMHQLHHALRQVHLTLEEGVLTSDTTHQKLPIYSEVDQRTWLHELRELCRNDLAYRLAIRRPREFGHCQQGINRDATIGLWKKCRDPQQTTILRNWHTGSLAYKERQWRHQRGMTSTSPYCTWCWHQDRVCVRETVRHSILECTLGDNLRQDPRWSLVEALPMQTVETGIIANTHTLTKEQLTDWPHVQQSMVNILLQRNRVLPDMEQAHGSPPACPKHDQVPRHRLVGKQPPTASCPTLQPRTRRCPNSFDMMIAEPNEQGEWLFNNHRVVPLPPFRDQPIRALLCIRCRRSARMENGDAQQALKIIHKRNRMGCAPSAIRCKIDATLDEWLPKAHLELCDEGARASFMRCGKCGDCSTQKSRWDAWAHKHALCHWLDTP